MTMKAAWPAAWIALVLALAAPASAATRPFPYHASYAAGVIRSTVLSQQGMDHLVANAYATWKTNYLRKDGGEYWVKYDTTNSTVSEAHGYGMVLAGYMADRAVFDSMFRYFKAHPSVNAAHLMAWKQTLKNGAMVDVGGPDSATDGDLDIAYALLLGHVQWGSAGAINYRAEALAVMHDILAHEVNAATLTTTPGDWATGADANHTRPSDFMTDHFLAFARYDTANATAWRGVHAKVAAIVNYQFDHGSQATGLVPDFMVLGSGGHFVPTPGKYLETAHDGDFYWNACRTPWRLAMSYIVNGRTAMLPALRREANWISTRTAGHPSRIKAGYYVLNGINGTNFVSYTDLAFVAPMAVAAMAGGPSAQGWLNALWTSITGGDFGPVNDYFGDTIRTQALIVLAGDWWAP
jgi:endo-1,4-beta-D-glucanase Y